MAGIELRPDLKTSGGEVSDILYKQEFIGTLTLVYREADRISGAIQLDEEALSAEDKAEVVSFLQRYIQHLIQALRVEQCDVLVTYSEYDHIIATPEREAWYEGSDVQSGYLMDEDTDAEWVQDGSRLEDIDPYSNDEFEMTTPYVQSLDYDLVYRGEEQGGIEYHIYDQEAELVAEAFVQVYGTDVVGTVEWRLDPFEEEMDHVTEQLIAVFNEDEVDTFVIHMTYNGEVIETMELTHTDLLDNEEGGKSPLWAEPDREDYTIVLARDDGDTLTYEIYQQSYGGLPIGTATVDISERQLTGFIDFREPGSSDDRELIATLLMEELDKEKEYDTFNLSMLHKNKLIDEILFEAETVH